MILYITSGFTYAAENEDFSVVQCRDILRCDSALVYHTMSCYLRFSNDTCLVIFEISSFVSSSWYRYSVIKLRKIIGFTKMSMPTSPFNPVTHAPIKAAILYNFSMQSPKMGRNFPKPRSGNRLKIVMKQSSCRSRSAADAQRSNCEAPERTAAERRQQPWERTRWRQRYVATVAGIHVNLLHRR